MFALVLRVYFGVDKVYFIALDHVIQQTNARSIQEEFKALVVAIVHYLCAHDVNLSFYGYK